LGDGTFCPIGTIDNTGGIYLGNAPLNTCPW
jgi:hypothetical protein